MNTQPEAHIALRNNRLKAYSDVIYLKDGEEFQIELFNPTQLTVLAKIKVNGTLISNKGILIKPGQRHFLDRHIDTSNKFKFNTYHVTGSTEQVLKAIELNGSVQVDFYNEVSNTNSSYTLTTTHIPTDGLLFGNSTANWAYDSTYTSPYMPYDVSLSSNLTNTSTYTSIVGNGFHTENVKPDLETGRVEQGNESDQKLSYSLSNFSTIACGISYWKILPDSHKPIEVKEIRNYCSSCGTRIKKQGWKFCPSCGEKL